MISKLKFINFGVIQEHYKVVILVKEDSLNKNELINYYINPIIQQNPTLKHEDFIALNLDYDGKTAKVNAVIKPWLTFLGETIKCDLILVADSAYYKVMSGAKKATHAYGSVTKTTFKGIKDIDVALTLSYRTVFYDTKNQDKISLTNAAIAASLAGKSLFQNIVHKSFFPETFRDIKKFLKSLLDYPILTCDIEAFSLKHTQAGIGTIAFAWNKNEGGAFLVDYFPTPHFGVKFDDYMVKKLLAQFFYEYIVIRGHKLIWHNISYDAKVLIWELIMEADHTNKKKMLEGLELFTNPNSFEDTKIIAYLATNSAAGNELKLKSLALPFAGNYALESDDIKDIKKVEKTKLLRYNLIDCLSTWYVYDTYYPIMVKDKQESVYKEIFKPSVTVLMQAELHGMPIDQSKVQIAKKILSDIVDATNININKNPYVQIYTETMRCNSFHELHAKWVKKTASLSDKAFDFYFNMNSPTQLVGLLYTMLELPVLDKTETGLPAAGTKTLKKLKTHTTDPLILEILDIVIEFNGAIKILTSFIPAFENAYKCPKTGYSYLMGNFNIGGTVSGRLSCSNPNLQQIPSGSVYAKIIKDCFIAPKGRLMVGLDFNSLEDYISALTTKDPNKLKVYLEGYDGHSLRAFKYFPERLKGIIDTIPSINSIKNLFKKVREDSKAPTFALTYQGTWKTLMTNCGFSEELAKKTEANFQELYAVSVQYIQDKLSKASVDGYIDVAFGLRVRTPVLSKALWGSSLTPYEALAEGRTAGNACGQSYGLLNNRAAIDFQKRVFNSKWRLAIFPIAHIHDAQYFIIDEDVDLLGWMNKELVECVQWQELPEIQHDKVKLGGDLSVFYPAWSNEIVIPNGMFRAEDIKKHLRGEYAKYKKENT